MLINKVKQKFPYILLLGLSLPIMLIHLSEYPIPWYDEGLATQAASTYQVYSVYGTYTVRGFNPFDPALTTGPTILLPVAWLFHLFGPGMFQARVVPAIYTILAVFLLYNLNDRTYGRRVALFVTLTFLLIPQVGDTGFFMLGRQVLGETASFAFILLGLTCWLKEWKGQGAIWGGLSGLAFGLVSISKLQSSIPVVFVLVVLSAVRFLGAKPTRQLRILLAPLITLVMIAVWIALPNMGYADSFRVENQQASLDAIQLLILPGFWQRKFSRTGFIMLAGMTLAVISSTWGLRRQRDVSQWSRNEWLRFAFGVMTLSSGLWWSLLSIGWVRYGYFSWMTALVILSQDAWVVFLRIRDKLFPEANPARRIVYPLAIAGLVALTLVFQAPPLLKAAERDDAQEMADYIRDYVDREDVIESWDWQVDALSEHREFNHPPQSLLLIATRQRFIEQTPYDLKYDLLQANPDFLLTGPFSTWTGVYDHHEVGSLFSEAVSFGPYTFWLRNDETGG